MNAYPTEDDRLNDDDILGPDITDAEFDAIWTVEELRAAVKEGLESGTSEFTTMEEIRAEAHRRFEAEKRRGD